MIEVDYLSEQPIYPLVIPGFVDRSPKFSPKAPLRRLSETVRAIGLQPHILRSPEGRIEQVNPDIPGVTGKAQVVENWLRASGSLSENNNIRIGGEGHVNEFISQDILQVIARNCGTQNGNMYGVEPAPYPLDPTDKENRGGDLLLKEYDTQGIPQAICLIDVKLTTPTYQREDGRTRVHGRRLRSGMNRRLGYPIPTIVVFVGDISLEDQKGRKMTLREYVNETVYEMAKKDNFASFLPGIARSCEEIVFKKFQERIHAACLATKERIKQTARSKKERDVMLRQLAITDKILGVRRKLTSQQN